MLVCLRELKESFYLNIKRDIMCLHVVIYAQFTNVTKMVIRGKYKTSQVTRMAFFSISRDKTSFARVLCLASTTRRVSVIQHMKHCARRKRCYVVRTSLIQEDQCVTMLLLLPLQTLCLNNFIDNCALVLAQACGTFHLTRYSQLHIVILGRQQKAKEFRIINNIQITPSCSMYF